MECGAIFRATEHIFKADNDSNNTDSYNAARTTNETQVHKVPNGRPQGAYGSLTDLFAKLDNARPVQREREKSTKGIPNTRICNS